MPPRASTSATGSGATPRPRGRPSKAAASGASPSRQPLRQSTLTNAGASSGRAPKRPRTSDASNAAGADDTFRSDASLPDRRGAAAGPDVGANSGASSHSLPGILLDRTLHLHSCTPLHFPVVPSRQGSSSSSPRPERPSTEQLAALTTALRTFLALRFSASSVGSSGAAGVPSQGIVISGGTGTESGTLRLEQVKAEWLTAQEGEDEEPISILDGDDASLAWALEIGLSRTESNASRSVSRKVFSSAHIVFLPSPAKSSRRGKEPEASLSSAMETVQGRYSYPIILSKSPSASISASTPGGAPQPSNFSKRLVEATLDFVSRFLDCRIGSGAPNVALRRQGKLEGLVEKVVRMEREREAKGGATMTARALDEMEPLELSWALPSSVSSGKEVLKGPAPDLSHVTVTLPWSVIVAWCKGQPLDKPIMPAIAHYVSSTTSLDLSSSCPAPLTLVRIGVLGVQVGLTNAVLVTPNGGAGAGRSATTIGAASGTQVPSSLGGLGSAAPAPVRIKISSSRTEREEKRLGVEEAERVRGLLDWIASNVASDGED